MHVDIQEIYQTTILPLTNNAKLQIATLILEDVTRKSADENGSEVEDIDETNGERETEHPLELLGRIPKIDAPLDFAERHDFYALGKLED